MSSHPWAIYPIPIAWLPRAGLQGLGGTVWATTGGNPGGCPLLSTGSTGVPPPGTSSGWASTGAELRRPAQGLRVSLGLGHRDHLNPTRPGPPARSATCGHQPPREPGVHPASAAQGGQDSLWRRQWTGACPGGVTPGSWPLHASRLRTRGGHLRPPPPHRPHGHPP